MSVPIPLSLLKSAIWSSIGYFSFLDTIFLIFCTKTEDMFVIQSNLANLNLKTNYFCFPLKNLCISPLWIKFFQVNFSTIQRETPLTPTIWCFLSITFYFEWCWSTRQVSTWPRHLVVRSTLGPLFKDLCISKPP